MRLEFGALAFIAAVSLALPSLAATLTAIEGQVSINRGRGFERVSGAVKVNAGDAVMAGPGGGAEIVFDDGCRLLVMPGTVETVPAKSPCDKGTAVRHFETKGSTGGSTKDVPVEESSVSTTTLVVGGVAVAGAVAAGVFLLSNQDKDKDKPASP